MSKSNRLRNVALGVAILAGLYTVWVGANAWLLPEPPNIAEGQPPYVASETYRPGGAQCDPEQLQRIAAREDRERQAGECEDKRNEYERQQSDLVQQWRSANAAEHTASYSFAQLRVSLAESLLLLLTLAATAYAALAAAAAARSADKAVAVAEQDLKEANRPRLRVEIVRIKMEPSDAQTLWVRVSNFGERAAIIEDCIVDTVSIDGANGWSHRPSPRIHPFKTEKSTARWVLYEAKQIVPNGDPLEGRYERPRPFTADELGVGMGLLLSPNVYVVGKLTYRNHLQRRCEIGFLFSLENAYIEEFAKASISSDGDTFYNYDEEKRPAPAAPRRPLRQRLALAFQAARSTWRKSATR
jgi:hypothetical protein